MKFTYLVAAAAMLVATSAAADPVEGVWKTQPGDDGNYGLVTIAACGAEICGTLGKGYDKIASFRRQVEHFVGVLNGEQVELVDTEDALASVSAIQAMERPGALIACGPMPVIWTSASSLTSTSSKSGS